MHHVSAQGVDKRMINVHYYYYNGAHGPHGYLTLHPVVGGPTEFLRHGAHGPHGYHLHDHAGDGGAGHGGHEAAQGQVHLHPAAGGARVPGRLGVVRRLQHPALPGVRDAAHHCAGNNDKK